MLNSQLVEAQQHAFPAVHEFLYIKHMLPSVCGGCRRSVSKKCGKDRVYVQLSLLLIASVELYTSIC